MCPLQCTHTLSSTPVLHIQSHAPVSTCPEASQVLTSTPASPCRSLPRPSPVLHHVHHHPVTGIHCLPNQVFEKDKSLHEEVLQGRERYQELSWTAVPSGGCCEGGAGARGLGVAVGQHSPSAQAGRGMPGCRCCSGPCPSGSGWWPCRPRSGSGGEELVRPCWVLQLHHGTGHCPCSSSQFVTQSPNCLGVCSPPLSLIPSSPAPQISSGPFTSSSQTVYPTMMPGNAGIIKEWC